MPLHKKTLAIVTGSRAEYGLLKGVIDEFQKLENIEVLLVVTGSHLSDGTVADIEADGHEIAAKIDVLKFGNDRVAIAKTTAFAFGEFCDFFTRQQPDGVLVLGDRYEIFAVASAAAMLGIPIFHISGGDVTAGAIDDALRHCITKLASVHFPSCATYAKRLERLGEQPSFIFNVGGLGDENIRKTKFLTPAELSLSLDFNFERPFILVTYHPETLSDFSPEEQTGELVKALERLCETHGDFAVVITGANADAGGEKVNAMLRTFCDKAPKQRFFIMSMGVLRYLSAMKYAAVVLGNSSSGVCETPSFGVPTVNIGDRQKGRLISENILCCRCCADDIYEHTVRALFGDFAMKCKKAVSPYRGERTAHDIARITAEKLIAGVPKTKEFYDAT